MRLVLVLIIVHDFLWLALASVLFDVTDPTAKAGGLSGCIPESL